MSDFTTEETSHSSTYNEQRKKRVKRLKASIIALALVFLLMPSICCIFIGAKMAKLQKQVNRLMVLHNLEDVSESKRSDNIAFAAEKTEEIPKELPVSIKTQIPEENSNPPQQPDQMQTEAVQEGPASKESEAENIQETADNIKSDSDADKDSELLLSENEDTYETVDIDLTDGMAVPAGDAPDETEGRFTGKKVYLTFDDGPSIYTDDILDILKDYGVRATFFVIGRTDSYSKEMYKRIVDEGHTLGMHSYSHKYSVIYNSLEDFDKDFTKLWNLLYDTTGLEPKIYRFPGGSANEVNKNGMKEFIRYLNKKSIAYYDWNVLNGDATNIKYTDEQLIANVLSGVESKKISIVLMHDAASKEATVRTLPALLEALISEGAELYPLDETVKPIQMIKADSVK